MSETVQCEFTKSELADIEYLINVELRTYEKMDKTTRLQFAESKRNYKALLEKVRKM